MSYTEDLKKVLKQLKQKQYTYKASEDADYRREAERTLQKADADIDEKKALSAGKTAGFDNSYGAAAARYLTGAAKRDNADLAYKMDTAAKARFDSEVASLQKQADTLQGKIEAENQKAQEAARKAAEKEAAAAQKAAEKAQKEAQKAAEKAQKEAQKEAEKAQKESAKQNSGADSSGKGAGAGANKTAAAQKSETKWNRQNPAFAKIANDSNKVYSTAYIDSHRQTKNAQKSQEAGMRAQGEYIYAQCGKDYTKAMAVAKAVGLDDKYIQRASDMGYYNRY